MPYSLDNMEYSHFKVRMQRILLRIVIYIYTYIYEKEWTETEIQATQQTKKYRHNNTEIEKAPVQE